MTKRVIVTGATGLLGSHLLWELLQRGHSVVAVGRNAARLDSVRRLFAFYGDADGRQFDSLGWACADVLDYDSLLAAFAGADEVYHTAAQVSLSRGGRAMWRCNVDGTRNVVQAVAEAGVGALCHVSSIAAVGSSADGRPADEDKPWQPSAGRSVYSQSKFASEMIVWQHIHAGLNAVIVNPGVIVGPAYSSQGSGAIARTAGVPFYVDGSATVVDVRDVAACMCRLMDARAYGRRFVVGGHNCTVRDVQTAFARAYGRREPGIRIGRPALMAAATVLDALAAVSGLRFALTRQSVRSVTSRTVYSSQRVTEATGIAFRTLAEAAQNCRSYVDFCAGAQQSAAANRLFV